MDEEDQKRKMEQALRNTIDVIQKNLDTTSIQALATSTRAFNALSQEVILKYKEKSTDSREWLDRVRLDINLVAAKGEVVPDEMHQGWNMDYTSNFLLLQINIDKQQSRIQKVLLIITNDEVMTNPIYLMRWMNRRDNFLSFIKLNLMIPGAFYEILVQMHKVVDGLSKVVIWGPEQQQMAIDDNIAAEEYGEVYNPPFISWVRNDTNNDNPGTLQKVYKDIAYVLKVHIDSYPVKKVKNTTGGGAKKKKVRATKH